MTQAVHLHPRTRSARRRGFGPRGPRARRRFRPCDLWTESLLEVRITPSTLDLASGQLAYAAADGEANRLSVDVTQVNGADYVRFQDADSITIKATGAGLVIVSPREVLAPAKGLKGLSVDVGDEDDTVSLVLSAGLPPSIGVNAGPAVDGDSVTVYGTPGDDAIALTPGSLTVSTPIDDGGLGGLGGGAGGLGGLGGDDDGGGGGDGGIGGGGLDPGSQTIKAVALTENGAVANIAVTGVLNIDLSQDGADSLAVDRAITGYGEDFNLNVVGGGDKPDSLSVTASGTVPQRMTLTDGHVRVDDAQTGSEIFLGRSDNIAIDQPKVTIEVIDSQHGDASLGPQEFSTFLLDTGATSILAAGEATSEIEQAGDDDQTPFRKYDTPYQEQGVGGFDSWNVSKPYRVDYAGDSGVRNTLNDVQFLNSETNSFSFLGPWGIVGMPAMVDKVTTVDMSGWHDPQDVEDLSMKVDFSSTPPAPTGHQYTVPLKLQDFPADGRVGDDGPVPTMAPLSFVHVATQNGGYQTQGEFLVDTGAQLSMISTATAIALGLDKNHNGSLEDEAVDHIQVGGVGGTVDVPLLAVDRASVATDQGPSLVWTDLLVGVLDISTPGEPQIDGVFGMDYLTSGWASKVLPGLLGTPGQAEDGYFQHVSFDFRDASNHKGSMILDVSPEHDVVTDPKLSTLNVSYTNIGAVSVATGASDDVFSVAPSAGVSYALDGGGQTLGDRLNLSAGGLAVRDDGSTASIDGYKDIHYSNFEYKSFGASAAPGATLVPTKGLTTTEAGGTASFTIVLDSRPTADVTIGLSSSDATEGTLSISSVTFTPDDWSAPQTVVVKGVDDAAADGDVAYTIVTAPAVSGDAAYNGLNPADVAVTNIDDDPAAATVTVDTSKQDATYGDSLTFSATVGGAGTTPSGTVQFVVDGADFGDPVVLSGGKAGSLATALLGAGSHVVQAFYSGDTRHAGGVGSLAQVVARADLAVVADDKGRAVGAPNPALTYHLAGFVNGEDAKTAGVAGSPVLAANAATDSPAGAYSIAVTSAGTLTAANYDFPAGRFGAGTLTVTPGAATVAVGSTLPASTYGQAVSFKATVAGLGPAPTGAVQFVVDGKDLGSPVTLAGGSATSISTAALGAGSHAVTARYVGDANYTAADAGYTQVVAKATPVLTWANPADIVSGAPLGASQLNATASTPGSFVYSPAAGAVLGVGAGQKLTVAFTPADSANYDMASRTVLINVLAAPEVQGVVVNDGSAQRSMVTKLVVTIDRVVTLDQGAVALQHRGGDDVGVNVTTSASGGHTIVMLTFAGGDVVDGSLADGRYTLTLHGDLIHDASGAALDGDGDGKSGGDYVDEAVFRLYGDSNGDGGVDNTDVLLFKEAYNKQQGQDGYLGFLDSNGDGSIDALDFTELKKRYGTNLFS